MEIGKLYFVKDEFYKKFIGCGLSENKEIIDGKLHNRPCCYLFKYKKFDENIYWMIPLSSQIEKYESEEAKSIEKYGLCDNISFGYILGEKKAFLPQNLFPIIDKYVDNIYIDKNTNIPISIPTNLMSELNAKARKKIRYNKENKKFGMTNIIKIYNELIKELEKETNN